MAKNEYAVFPVAVAKEMLRVYRQLQASGLLGRDTIESIVRRVPRSIETPVFFRNDSGEEVPRYACMQVTGTVESGGQNFCTIDKPADTDSSSGEYIFNGHEVVLAGGSDAQYGTSQGGRFVRAIKASGTSTAGDKWNPVVGDWTIEQDDSGRFVMAGDDDIGTDIARVFVGDGGGSGASLSGVATSWGTQSSGDFAGLKYADVTVIEASNRKLLGTSVRVYDRKGCILDIDVTDYTVWAHELWASSMDTSKECPAAVRYWSADDRCCDADTAIYREC
jgi:hypothetical protein